MFNLAIIENLIVTNIIVANDPTNYPAYTDVTGVVCNIGWTDNQDGTFTAPITPTPIKRVGMGILGELLPMTVLLEIEDFKSDTTNTQALREIATQILMFIYADRPLDVYGDKFTTLMTRLVNNTALTSAEAIAIQTQLQDKE